MTPESPPEIRENPPELPPTLSAVAKLAGVSSITVSRVVRLPGQVAPETRARVERAMRELGYIPNLVAGALASARTNSVGVLVPTIANSIFADTVQGLSDRLEPAGFSVILAQSRYDAEREDRMLAALLSRRPEAIIMVGSPATEDGARLRVAHRLGGRVHPDEPHVPAERDGLDAVLGLAPGTRPHGRAEPDEVVADADAEPPGRHHVPDLVERDRHEHADEHDEYTDEVRHHSSDHVARARCARPRPPSSPVILGARCVLGTARTRSRQAGPTACRHAGQRISLRSPMSTDDLHR